MTSTNYSAKNKPSPLVIQHNQLIEARYKLSLQEKRLILWLISQIKLGDIDFLAINISVRELADYLEVSSHNFHSILRETTSNLIGRTLEIYSPTEKKYNQFAWLHAAIYYVDQGLIELHISPFLKPYLLELKQNFTQLQLAHALSLNSTYSIRLYELLKQYQKIGQREMTLADLKAYLGIENGEYKLFGHLRSAVIERACQEINAKTSLRVQMEFIKRSRKITGIRFLIQDSPNSESQDEDIPVEYLENPLFKQLKAYGFSVNKCIELLKNYSSDNIQSTLHEIYSQLQKGKDISNPSGWILSALKNNWELSPDLPAIHQQTETARQDKISQELSELRQQQQQQEQKRLFDGHQKTLVQERWMLLEPNQQEDLLAQILSSDFLRRSWDNSGMKSPVIISLLRPHLLSAQEQDINQWIRHQV